MPVKVNQVDADWLRIKAATLSNPESHWGRWTLKVNSNVQLLHTRFCQPAKITYCGNVIRPNRCMIYACCASVLCTGKDVLGVGQLSAARLQSAPQPLLQSSPGLQGPLWLLHHHHEGPSLLASNGIRYMHTHSSLYWSWTQVQCLAEPFYFIFFFA